MKPIQQPIQHIMKKQKQTNKQTKQQHPPISVSIYHQMCFSYLWASITSIQETQSNT